MKTILGFIAAFVLVAAAAMAQNVWPTPTAGANLAGQVITCLNAAGQAVPCGSLQANTPPVEISAITTVPHYSAAVDTFGNSSTGDILCVAGGVGKVVRVKHVTISGVASNATMNSVSLIKRSSLDSGGTPTAVTAVPNDSTNPAAVATVTAYATDPTPGTQVGVVRAQRVPIGSVTTLVGAAYALFNTATPSGQPLVLRGASEALCVRVNNTAGGQWDIDTEWTEEAQ